MKPAKKAMTGTSGGDRSVLVDYADSPYVQLIAYWLGAEVIKIQKRGKGEQ